MDQLPRLGKRGLICLLLFTCNYVVSVRRGFLFLWVLGMGYVFLLWNSLSLPYNYFSLNVSNMAWLNRKIFEYLHCKVPTNDHFYETFLTNEFFYDDRSMNELS